MGMKKGLAFENVRIALSAIRAQMLRTSLTLVIIAIGITALVCILTVVSALENTLNSNFAAMGSNTFSLQQYEQTGRNFGEEPEKNHPVISYAQAQAFKEAYDWPGAQTSIHYSASSTAQVAFENQKTDPEINVMGVDAHYIGNNGLVVEKGRNFSPIDIEHQSLRCVVGADFASKGLLKEVNPVGQVLRVKGMRFEVIGVLKAQGSSFGQSRDLRVLIPISVARSLFSAPQVNYNVSTRVADPNTLDGAVDEARSLFRNIRNLTPLQDDNFGIVRSDDLVQRIGEISGTLTWAAWIIGIITILGSSIALMNIMVVSVTERTREIGIRKALGANRRTIAWQFFTETLVIGQLGGLIGILLGILSGYGIASLLDFGFVIPWQAISAAVVTSFIVALVSGLYPALKASRLDPIEALRYE